MKKLFYFFYFLPVWAFAEIDVSQTTGAMNEVADVLTNKFLVGLLTLILIIVGYMYLFNKGNVAKEWLIAIIVGVSFILSASAFAAIFG